MFSNLSDAAKQTLKIISSSPVIRYMNNVRNKWQKGVIKRVVNKPDLSGGYLRTPGGYLRTNSGEFLDGLIAAFNASSEDQQVEFLQDHKERAKIFEITIGLLEYLRLNEKHQLTNGTIFQCEPYLNAFLAMIAVDEGTEADFYHSEGFIFIFTHYFIKDPHNKKVKEVIFSAMDKYPDIVSMPEVMAIFEPTDLHAIDRWLLKIVSLWTKIEILAPQSPLFSKKNIQSMLNRYVLDQDITYSNKALLLMILKTSMAYKQKQLTPDLFSQFLFRDEAPLGNCYFLATTFIDFLDDPEQLLHYFPNPSDEFTADLIRFIQIEKILRKTGLNPFNFVTAASYCFDDELNAREGGGLDYLINHLHNIAIPAREEEIKQKVTQFFSATQEVTQRAKEYKGKVILRFSDLFHVKGTGPGQMIAEGCTLSDEMVFLRMLQENRNQAINIVNRLESASISPDMAMRVLYHELKKPELKLLDQLLPPMSPAATI